MAVFRCALFTKSVPAPIAVFCSPMVLFRSASAPMAVFSSAIVFCASASAPMAVLFSPVVFLRAHRLQWPCCHLR